MLAVEDFSGSDRLSVQTPQTFYQFRQKPEPTVSVAPLRRRRLSTFTFARVICEQEKRQLPEEMKAGGSDVTQRNVHPATLPEPFEADIRRESLMSLQIGVEEFSTTTEVAIEQQSLGRNAKNVKRPRTEETEQPSPLNNSSTQEWAGCPNTDAWAGSNSGTNPNQFPSSTSLPLLPTPFEYQAESKPTARRSYSKIQKNQREKSKRRQVSQLVDDLGEVMYPNEYYDTTINGRATIVDKATLLENSAIKIKELKRKLEELKEENNNLCKILANSSE